MSTEIMQVYENLFPSKVMDEDLFRKIIAECAHHKEIEMINLFMNNEPLTDPHLGERITHAKRNVPWAYVCIFTNGSLLTDKRIKSLTESKLDAMNISFHGIRKYTVEDAMGIPYETSLRRINRFIKVAKKRWILRDFLGVNFLRHQYLCEEEKEEALRYWKKRGIKKVSFYAGPISRAGNVKDLPKTHHAGNVVGCLSVVEDEMIHICEDGTVILCCMDWKREVPLGNLNNESIRGIWNGRRKEVWDMIEGRASMPADFLCRRCEEAAVSKTDIAETTKPDVVLALLPPSRNEGLAGWTKSLSVDLNARNVNALFLDLDREFRNKASEAQKSFWAGNPSRRFLIEENSRVWLEKQGVRELLNGCVQILVSVHASSLALPAGRANQRFALEVIKKIKELAPDMKIFVLERDRRIKARKTMGPELPENRFLTDGNANARNIAYCLKGTGMKILMVHPHDLFSVREPWTIRIVSIARELAKRGHRVTLCYFPLPSENRERPCHIENIETIPLDRKHSPVSLISNTRKLLKLCRESDIVHFQKCHSYASLPVLVASHIARTPTHYDWDDWEEKIFYESVQEVGIITRCLGYSYKVLETRLPRWADSVSCASLHLRSLTESFGVPGKFIADAPVGADLERFHPRLDGNRIKERYGIRGNLVLYVGQLCGAQYVDLFIEAAVPVLAKLPDVTFMIVGDGFLRPQLENLTRELGVDRQIIFTGAVPHEQVPFYMAAADVCVASFRDTEVTRCKSPLKIAEYLASGKPIVASDVGEVKRMVGKGGIVVESGEHKGLAESILKVLGDSKLREHMGRSARSMAEKVYNWPQTVTSLLDVYHKIV